MKFFCCKTLQESLEEERSFLKKEFPSEYLSHGTSYLCQTLCSLLQEHIKKHLPALLDKIAEEIKICRKKLDKYGKEVSQDDRERYLTEVSNNFASIVKDRVDSSEIDTDTKELTGGARLKLIFTALEAHLSKSDPFEFYSIDEVVHAIRQADGPNSPPPPSFVAFRALTRKMLQKMEKPCLDSLDSSVNALFSIGSESLPENVGTQYPLLKTEILTALSQVIEDHTAKPAQMIRDTVRMECCHIRTNLFKEEIFDGQREIPTEMLFKKVMIEKMPYEVKFRGNDQHELKPRRTEEEERHAILIGDMLRMYVKRMAQKLSDTLAKAIMCFLVTPVVTKLDGAVNSHIKAEERWEKIFCEEETVARRRREAKDQLQVLEEAERDLKSGIAAARILNRMDSQED